MAVFCSSFTSWFPGMLFTYFLNYFEIVPTAPAITGITFVFTLLLLLLLLLLCLLSQAFFPSTSPLKRTVIPTTQASSFMLQDFPIICDVPNFAVIFIEAIACVLVMA
jgi:hypothetical protein